MNNSNIIEESSINIEDFNIDDLVAETHEVTASDPLVPPEIPQSEEPVEESVEETDTAEVAEVSDELPLVKDIISEVSLRFSSAEWYGEVSRFDITLLGLGGIGSYACYFIGRLQPANIVLYDPDTIEEHNLSGQMFFKRNIGEYKASIAARELLSGMSDHYGYYVYNERFNSQNINNIVICGFDNMSSRQLAFMRWKEYVNHAETEEERKRCLFIDGRLAAEEFQIYCITGEDVYLMDKYSREALFNDSEAEETVCSYKQTSFCAGMIGAFIANLVVNFAMNLTVPDIRPLPYLTTYDCTTMMFKTYDA